jgi:hypothetical protein
MHPIQNTYHSTRGGCDRVQAEYIYSIPYTGTYLPEPLAYPVHLWVNSETNMIRIDVYDGLDSELHRDGAVYYWSPRIDKYACQWWYTGEATKLEDKATPAHIFAAIAGSAPNRNAGGDLTLGQAGLPDFKKWKFEEKLVYNGVQAEKWTFKLKVHLRFRPLPSVYAGIAQARILPNSTPAAVYEYRFRSVSATTSSLSQKRASRCSCT